MPSYTAYKKAFAHALAKRLAIGLGCDVASASDVRAQKCYLGLSLAERSERDEAARAAVAFLMDYDRVLVSDNIASVRTQTDRTVVGGDIRDIVIVTNNGQEIGISTHNRHIAIRNSRLCPTVDFGRECFGSPCSDNYFASVAPIFRMLVPHESAQVRWEDTPAEQRNIYVPLLNVFMEETRRMFIDSDAETVAGMTRYMLGRYDHYKVYEENGHVIVESFNIVGRLGWGSKLAMSSRFIELRMEPGSKTTANMILDECWQFCFRIRNAENSVAGSPMFDVKIIGQPTRLSRHEIMYR